MAPLLQFTLAAALCTLAAAQTQIINEQDGSQLGITFTQYPFTYNGGPRWKYDTREYGYSYVSSERPLANVPYSILKGENFFGYSNQLFCNQSATYNNLTCSNPPEQVSLTWMTQSLGGIDTKEMTHTLNFYLKVQWRDWRLSYTEGGVTCFNATTPPIALGSAASYDTAALVATLYASLLDAWGCDALNGCYPFLPRGVAPAVTAAYTDATNTSLVVSVFPAPNFLYAPGGPDGSTVDANSVPPAKLLYTPSAGGSCTIYPCSSAEQYTTFLFDALAQSGDPALTGVAAVAATSKAFLLLWPKTAIRCTGVRRTPGYLILVSDRQADQPAPLGNAGYGDYRHPHLPSIVNPNSFWTPFMIDSVNQVGAEEQIMDQWQLFSNGTVIHQYHFNVEYKAVMPLQAFPFDSHYFIGTRRTRSQMTDRVRINVARAGFSIPPKNAAWRVGESAAIVCPRKEITGFDDSDCRPLCTNVTCPGWQPGMPSMYVPPAGGCPPNPSCNATYPFAGCAASCGETAALCQDVFVFYYRVSRKPEYFLQNMLAPIILITIMAAAAYWNELDDYADRVGLMATALLSMMALQAYVADALPETQTITFIHFALYTSYALMGFGLAFIIAASFCLKRDVEAAKGDATAVKVWMMRQYYMEAITAARLLHYGGSAELRYFPELSAVYLTGEAAATAAAAATVGAGVPSEKEEARAGGAMMVDVAPSAAQAAAAAAASEPRTLMGRVLGRHLVAAPSKRDDDGALATLYVPSMPLVRRCIVELDNFMRFGHLLSFAVVIGARYFSILTMETPAPTCATLLNFIAPTDE